MKFLESLFWSSNADPAELPTLTGKAAFNKFNLEPIDETEEVLSDNTPDFSKEGPFFRDLDSGATELYNHIQLKRWNHALSILQASPEQAKVWIFRLEDDGSKLRWRVLPLHAALILKAPDNVIEALLRANRFAANAKDDQGSLPFHIGCKVGMSKTVAEMLLTVYPRSVIEKDGMNRFALSLLDIFKPSQKNEISQVIREQLGEYKTAFDSLEHQNEQREQPEEREDEVSPLRTMAPASSPQMNSRVRSAPVSVSIDMKKPVLSLLTKVAEDEESNDAEPEQILSEIQQKHKGQLIAMKEAMDIQDEASQVGEEMSVKSKLSQVQITHSVELQKLKDELSKTRQKHRAEEQKKLDTLLKQAEEKHNSVLQEVESTKAEAEKKGSHKAVLAKLHESIRDLKKKHEEHIAMIQKTAEIEREIARQEEGRQFEKKVRSFEEKQKGAVALIQAESKLQREKSRVTDLNEFEKKIQELEKAHQKELQETAKKLEKQRNALEKNQRELFDRRVDDMQRQHAKEMKEFQSQLVATQESNRRERARIVDTRIEQLQNNHIAEIEKIEQKSMETIRELEDTIVSLKQDLAKTKSSSLSNTALVQKSIQSMQKHMDETTTKATSQVKILEATVTTLETSLEKSRQQSVQLEEHVKLLEENLRLRQERDQEIEQRLNRMQRTCCCFEFST